MVWQTLSVPRGLPVPQAWAPLRLPRVPRNQNNACYANSALLATLAYPHPRWQDAVRPHENEKKTARIRALSGAFHESLWKRTRGAPRPDGSALAGAVMGDSHQHMSIEFVRKWMDYLGLNQTHTVETNTQTTVRYSDAIETEDPRVETQRQSGIQTLSSDMEYDVSTCCTFRTTTFANVKRGTANYPAETVDQYQWKNLAPWVFVVTGTALLIHPVLEGSDGDNVYLHAMLEFHGQVDETEGARNGHWTVALRCPQSPMGPAPWYHFDDTSAEPTFLASSTVEWLDSHTFHEHYERVKVLVYMAEVCLSHSSQTYKNA